MWGLFPLPLITFEFFVCVATASFAGSFLSRGFLVASAFYTGKYVNIIVSIVHKGLVGELIIGVGLG